MSSLFRQIFSEATLTEYHNMIRTNLRSIWPLLCEMLDLPSNLINNNLQNPTKQFSNPTTPLLQEAHNGSSGHNTNSNQTLSSALMRGSTTSQSLKFLNTFIEVLRILATGKLICLCLDDLQYADEESLELITNIIGSRLQVVLIVSHIDGLACAVEYKGSHSLSCRQAVVMRTIFQRKSGQCYRLRTLVPRDCPSRPFQKRQSLNMWHLPYIDQKNMFSRSLSWLTKRRKAIHSC